MIILNWISQTQKETYYMIPLIMKYWEQTNLQRGSRLVVIRVRVHEIKSYCLMVIEFLFRVMRKYWNNNNSVTVAQNECN